MESRILELATLVRTRACESSRMLFERVFGDKVEVTVERFSQPDVLEANFDYDWTVDTLLSEEQIKCYYRDLREKKEELKKKHEVHWYGDVPRMERRKLEATHWAEAYIKSGKGVTPPIEELKVEANHIVTEPTEGSGPTFPEESFNGY